MKMRTMWRAPLAVAYWLGAIGNKAFHAGGDTVFLCHGTPQRSAGRLELQLRFLRRSFAIVPFETIAASATDTGRPGQARRAAIIFDDGVRNNITVAYPILRALGVPATFFVCPGLIEERRWIWTREARRRLQFAAPQLRADLARALGAPPDIEPFILWMKRLQLADRANVEAALRHATRTFTPTDADREAFDLADWNELRTLDPAIVTIGSHSMTHPILPTLSDAAIEVELRESRRTLEAKLDRAAEFFSYPDSGVDWRVLAAARRHYRGAVAHSSGMPLDTHLVPSIHLPANVLRLALDLHLPASATAAAPQPFLGAGTTAL